MIIFILMQEKTATNVGNTVQVFVQGSFSKREQICR